MSEHAFVQENLAGYVADGLTAQERERFDRHVHGCGDCHRLLAEQRAFDDSLGKLFASARPAAGFENRVIAGLRAEPLRRAESLQRRIAWTKTWRWLGSAAAVLLLGVCGYGMHRVMENGSLPFPGEWGSQAQARSDSTGFKLGVDITGGTTQQFGLAFHEPILNSDMAIDRIGAGVRTQGKNEEGKAGGSMGVDADESKLDPMVKARLSVVTESLPELGGVVRGRNGKVMEITDAQDGTSNTTTYAVSADRLEALKQMDSAGKGEDWGRKTTMPSAAYRNAPAKDAPARDKATENRRAELDDSVKLRMKLSKEVGDVMDVAPAKDAVAYSRDGASPQQLAIPLGGGMPGGGGGQFGGGGFGGGGPRAGGGAAPFGGPGGGFGNKGSSGSPEMMPPSATTSTPAPQGLLGMQPATKPGQSSRSDFTALPGLIDTSKKRADDGLYYRVPVANAPGSGPSGPGGNLPPADSKATGKGIRFANPGDDSPKGNAAKNGGEYFKEVWGHLPADKLKDLDARDKAKGDDKKETPAAKGEQAKAPKVTADGNKLTVLNGESEKDLANTVKQLLSGQVQPEPKPVVRKIIRTGEVEFEIEGFDSAVASITQLISGIQGGFVATINSDKLPNGKVKGSIIVRMPPEHLDKFLLDMRKELAKVGELKGQRIGSQDVTKQYYDLESRMRAARTMEERLIDIIKKGKGEIKDLLLAEKELGVWRTKLEEMEGEIRYYNNQVGLSTLTITLYEKEIRAAAAMVITEHVNMKIEADDVEKSLQSALSAVTEAKGRVTKSDLKQHAAGQYEAILQFEVAPAAAPGVRDKLKTLGVVTHHDAQRLQQAEGGSTTKGEIKSRVTDVQFNVSFHNVANIQPRESYIQTLAVVDVPADYRKLQDAVNLAKGQVRSGNLDEKDKLNISAQFDFDVPSNARDTIDKLVAGLGDVLSKTTSRAAPGETATDRKVGYRLTLRSLIAIAPRESYKLDVATQDVPAEYRSLQDRIAEAKGQIRAINLNELDKVNTLATLDFDVPAADRAKFDKLLAGLGDVLTRNTLRVPPNETATERKIGYRLTLRNLATIQPRESYLLQIATQDVSADYRQLQDAIAAAKGQVKAINLSEQDKLNTTAQLDFDVSSSERAKFDKLINSLGEVIGRNTIRVAPGETATELKSGYRLTLRNIAGVPPRETYTLQTVSLDVPTAYRRLPEAVGQSKGYERNGQLSEPDKLNVSAQFDFDLPAGERDVLEKLLADVGEVYSRNTARLAPGEIATERKVGYRLRLNNAAAMTPREKVALGIEVKDVEQAANTFKVMVRDKGGTVVYDPVEEGASGRITATLLFNVPLAAKDELVRKFKGFGKVRDSKSSSNPQAPETKLATVHLDVILTNLPPIVPSDEGMWPQIRTSLSYSFRMLSLSLMFIVFGLSVVLPWALVLWVVVKLVKKIRGKAQPAATTAG